MGVHVGTLYGIKGLVLTFLKPLRRLVCLWGMNWNEEVCLKQGIAMKSVANWIILFMFLGIPAYALEAEITTAP